AFNALEFQSAGSSSSLEHSSSDFNSAVTFPSLSVTTG
ncbi:hypothetical protein A2U01_0080792, partial [Trifolium medium]|nr:hypothetical protein [Trifolium medium]